VIGLVTLNFGGRSDRHGSWDERRARASDVIGRSRADLVIGQAVPLDPPPVLSALEHMHVGGEGMLMMSRTPLAERQSIPLSRREGTEDSFDRVLISARIDSARPLTIVNAHMSWVAEQAIDNVREALAFSDTIDGDVILAGDLNQSADSDAMTMLRGADWIDAWAHLQGDTGGETFEVGKLWGRIDYVWARGSTADRLRTVKTIGGEGENALSDHLGLLCTIE